MESLGFRRATEDDVEPLIDIHIAAFPDPRGREARSRNFVANALGSLSDLWVCEENRRLVAHAFAFPLGAFFGGQRVPITGIASVGVAPTHRGRGVARALITHLHEVARERGDALALLHAFRDSFYAQLGYARVAPFHRLDIDPGSIPKEWVDAARQHPLDRWNGDAATPKTIYTTVAHTRTGLLDRPATLWTTILLDERAHVFIAHDGYVVFSHEQTEPHAAVRLVVRELVAESAETRRRLLGFLGMQAGQVDAITLDVATDDPILFALRDPDGHRHGTADLEHDLGCIASGPMVFMLDSERALSARGYVADGQISFDIDGKRLRLVSEEGRGKVEPSKDTDIVLSEQTLTSILFGGLPVNDAAALGLLSGSEAALIRANKIVALPPYFAIDTF